MTFSVELIYDLDCPNIDAARTQLMKAFATLHSKANWKEWDRQSSDCPVYAKQYGSPTILVNKHDVAGEQPNEHSDCCRLYCDENGAPQGVPSVETIATAITNYSEVSAPPVMRTPSSNWKSSLATVPGIAFAFMPKLGCPLCWPAYSGLLSSIGLGFLVETKYLFPMTIGFLVVVLGALAWGARSRHGYAPFYIGVVGSTVVLVGKFLYDSDFAMYCGIGLLVATSIWNAWPRKKVQGCPSCVLDSSTPQHMKRKISHE